MTFPERVATDTPVGTRGSNTSSVGVRQIGGFPVVAEASLFRLVTWLPSLLAVLVLICAIALAAGNLLSTGFAFEKNYNEGWNVYNAQRLIDHELINDDNYWRMNDYPIRSEERRVGKEC